MMGKNLDSLQESRDKRTQIHMKYGFIPTSIIEAKKNSLKSEDNFSNGSYTASQYQNPSMAKGIESIFSVSGQGVGSGALSRFPQNIGRFLVKMYSEEEEMILDPFAGHNSRMELVYKLGRNYTGFDICHSFMEFNRRLASELQGEGNQGLLFTPSNKITLTECDSRNLKTETLADMILTSPPYYDVEYYGDEVEQLGKCKTYKDFIDDITIIIRKCFESLKSGRYCCWSINDFRRNGIFHAYHSDIIQAYLQVGFRIHDIIIVDLGQPISAAFASQLEEQKRTAKRHEYVIVGKKP